MSRTFKKLIAVFLAIWLPLFSGNALAVAVLMHSSENCRPVAMQQDAHHATTDHQHGQTAQHAMSPDQISQHHAQQDSQQHQQNSTCENCGVCHLACTGYLAGAVVGVEEIQPPSAAFTAVSTLFQSITSAPLDPPPLARA